jgi:hypothetical protein
MSRTMDTVTTAEPTVELWVDDHQEYEPGVVHGHLRHARVPMDPQPGDYLIVGDDDAPPVFGRGPRPKHDWGAAAAPAPRPV